MISNGIWVEQMRFMNACFIYLAVQFGRCVMLSAAVLIIILIIRKVFLKNMIFGKGLLWCLLLPVLFMGKMKLFYESRLGVQLFYWWNELCIKYPVICWIYVAGSCITCFILVFKRYKLNRFVRHMGKKMAGSRHIFAIDMQISPFAVGLVCPKIVIPKAVLMKYSRKERSIILQHEKTHVRLGHLWLYLLLDILCVLLWPNLLLWFSIRYFKEDMEDICDKVVMQKTKENPKDYGTMLLKTVKILNNGNCTMKLPVSYVGGQGYDTLKSRMVKISGFQPYKSHVPVVLTVSVIFIITVMSVAVKHLSYPAYTEDDSIMILSKTGNEVLLNDSVELREAVYEDGENLHVSRKELDALFLEHGIEAEEFVAAFGGFMKLPGMGGGRNALYVDYSGTGEYLIVPYEDGGSNIYIKLYQIM